MEHTTFNSMRGFFKIWAVDPKTGKRTLLRDQQNMILNQGADLLAQALAGVQYANISHMYVAYQNIVGSVTPPTIDKEYSTPFSGYGAGSLSDYGYVRLPLAYSPSFLNTPDYDSNIVLFTSVISTADNEIGATFNISTDPTPSQIFEVALVSALDPSGSTQDKVFSRANFSPLLYDPNYNLTVTWGIQFVA